MLEWTIIGAVSSIIGAVIACLTLLHNRWRPLQRWITAIAGIRHRLSRIGRSATLRYRKKLFPWKKIAVECESVQKKVVHLERRVTDLQTEVGVLHHLLFNDIATLAKRMPPGEEDDLTYVEAIAPIMDNQPYLAAQMKGRVMPPVGSGSYLKQPIGTLFARNSRTSQLIDDIENTMILINRRPGRTNQDIHLPPNRSVTR